MFFPLLPSLRRLAVCAFSVIATSGVLLSQGEDGFTIQQKPGIALVKAQAWSNPAEATVYEFQAFTDRTVAGTGAGYYEFVSPAGNKRQIQGAQVVKLLIYPTANSFPQIVAPEDRAKVAALLTQVQAMSTSFPSTISYLKPSIKLLQGELAKYDSGNLKMDGVWKPKETYYAEQVANLRVQLRADILRADPPSTFDLDNDSRFVALQQMAHSSASASGLVAELSDLQGKRLRGEKRAALLKQLNQNSISFSDAEGAVAQLQTLQSQEDPVSDAFVKKWNTDLATLNAAKITAAPMAAEMEKEMAAVKTYDKVPVLAPVLSTEIGPLSGKMSLFLATSPVPALIEEARTPLAVYKISDALQKLDPLFQQHRFLEAKDVIDPLESLTSAIGPETTRVVAGMQVFATAKIDAFSRKREEANLLLNAHKPADALKAFEAAYAIIPDPALDDQIASLKKSVPTPTPSPAKK